MLQHVRHSLRFGVISLTLLRYGVLTHRKGEHLARAFEALGPSFIKLGQTLSTRPDLFGEEFTTGLANLRDRLPPFSTVTAKRIISEELGAPADTLFAEFDDTPAAAASVAQVHRARMHDGRYVAVKVIRPKVGNAFRRDIAFFYWGARVLSRLRPSLARLRLNEIVSTLERSVLFELDLRYEAAAITEMAENFADDPRLRVPQVQLRLTGERVMVTEWIDGIPVHDIAALKTAGHDLDRILADFSELFFLQALRDGYFHADLHPGNVFIDTEGRIALVDFGIMGRLSRKERIYIAEIFRGFLGGDYQRVAEMHFRAGYVPPHHSVEAFAQAARAIAEPILDRPAHEISMAKLLGQLFAVTETFDMETQPQLLLLQKSLVVVEGVGRMLNPMVNMWEMARAPIETWAQQQFSPRAKLREAAKTGSELMQQLPDALHRLDALLNRFCDEDGLRLHPDTVAPLLAERRKFRHTLLAIGSAALGLLAYAILR